VWGEKNTFIAGISNMYTLCTISTTNCITFNNIRSRGSATEWYEVLTCNLRSSKAVRVWFAQNVMFSQQGRFAEYLLECSSPEVRNAFGKVVVCLTHFALNDGAFNAQGLPGSNVRKNDRHLSEWLSQN